jgi:hypothetical protein
LLEPGYFSDNLWPNNCPGLMKRRFVRSRLVQ